MANFYANGDINSTERGSGARANGGKVSFSIVPLHLLAGCARVLMGGKLKYAQWNWAKGMDYADTYDSLMRHLFKWWYMREDYDTETMEHHLDHALANILFLKHYVMTHKEGDDRPGAELTGFPIGLDEFNTPFDEEAYLERNPAIKKMLEDREVKK